MVGFKVGMYYYEVGSSDFLYSFFSTVAVNLEKEAWGSRFPYLMRGLYSGNLPAAYAKAALVEAKHMRKELKAFPPSMVVWDASDRSKQPPWGDNISKDIKNLSNYFVTSAGEDFFDVLKNALTKAAKEKQDVEILSL